MPKWLFLVPFVIALIIEFFQQELISGGLEKGTVTLLERGAYLIALVLLAPVILRWLRNRK